MSTVHPREAAITIDGLDTFETAYVECALWLHDPEPGQGEWTDRNDLADLVTPEFLAEVRADCKAFREDAKAADLVEDNESQAGHDFWLTRNGHGAGFWDRGELYGSEAAGEYLSEHARTFGESDVYACDAGKLYLFPHRTKT